MEVSKLAGFILFGNSQSVERREGDVLSKPVNVLNKCGCCKLKHTELPAKASVPINN